ncbi:MAG: HpcH/HpaI aldolase/citrate lyase family protein [Melioribacteraceae bacterium]|nr:HpcH/HpaI aldolase/citrate lyase family protein [Melioribacteraceae bacterium]MCF8353428.1 HpcH/HpaI aldolase/citrate lyase family protein [Melioribacteraceae bacterium]MCF8393916.1 HpcH/HpaI aldolase/citrate lyase family protein [Melioribacteraceae bacterium]MCF8418989.1 HpcH/HpaI aldolase/citrate lyase family protein [Melioribacteraceae bacterium]
MKNKITKSFAGKRGDKIKSDCYIELKKKSAGGIKLKLESKVSSMYGSQIEDLIFDMCRSFRLRHAEIIINDFGALPFVIAARFESAVRRSEPEFNCEYLLEISKKNKYKSSKERMRRSRLYLPGNEPKFYPNAGLHQPDGIILDLEDSVAHSEKDSAQILVRNALRSVDFYKAERMVRINQLPKGLDDLKFIVPHNVHVILIPKCESAEQINLVEEEIGRLKSKHKIKNDIFFMPIIESALGVINSFDIASASNMNCALAVGLEDYTADIGVQRTDEGKESLWARSMIINSAKAAGIQAIDTVYSDVTNMEGLHESVIEAKMLGFEGKGCIHPRQIKVVHEAFAPTSEEIDKAKKIVMAFEEAEAKGIGVVSIGSKMIDAPVVKRARKIVKLAENNNLLSKNWREEN